MTLDLEVKKIKGHFFVCERSERGDFLLYGVSCYNDRIKIYEVSMRKNFGAKAMCHPMPVFIIGTYSADGAALKYGETKSVWKNLLI